MAAKGRKWVMKKLFDGVPSRSDLEIVEFEVPALKDGEVLVEAVVLSVDPYMRPYMKHFPEGSTMIGQQVAKVTKSKNPDFPEGTLVLVSSGWVTHTVSDGKNLTKIPPMPEGIPVSYALGGLGMPGLTAYFGLLKIANLKEGETVYVNGAAGAVGASVGQIAKIKGCRVIGSAGSDEKVEYLKKELGFDAAYNYKKVSLDNLDATLKSMAPDGIDVFFENVGGEASSIVVNNMRERGRVAICGGISDYNNKQPVKVTPQLFNHIQKRLTSTGFVVYDHLSDFPTALKEMSQWVLEGKLKFRETVHRGFDQMFEAFMDLFKGNNIGKVVIYME